MADYDRTRGYRDSSEAHRRPRPQPSQASGDPLAELARLIGQQNESAPSYRQSGARSPYGTEPEADRGWAAPDPAASHGYGNSHHDPRYDPQPGQDAGYGSASYAPASHDPRYADPGYADARHADGQYDPRYADPRYASDSGYASDPRYAEPHYEHGASQGYGSQGYADPRYGDPRYADSHYADPRYADPNFGEQQYGTSYGSAQHGYAQPGADHHGHPGYGYPQGGQPYADSYYGGAPMVPPVAPHADQQTPAKRRGSIVTVLAVLALAVVGTAAAFGYRAMFGTGGTPVPPPVITADTKPSKVVPATDPNSKPIQDRVGVKTERIIPRQEEPVQQQAAPGQPRVITPWLAGGQNPQAFPAASANVAPRTAAPQPAAAPPAAAEPKRIRTVPIKPERGAEAPRNTRTAAPASSPAEPEPDAAQSGSAPLALSATGSLPQRQAGRHTTTASLPGNGSSASPFPEPIASPSRSAPAAAAGAYGVQVTSQRSEADAQASFRSLQQQFPSVLGNRQPVIRRADLGERGTYYRAQVPFQSQSEANEFCSSLKSAGGQCVVQRN